MRSGIVIVIAAIGLVAFMPEQWEERIATITDPRAEQSANSRLETWTMLWNLALDRPFTGGGFETYAKWIFEKYNPAYDRTHAAHSIYFQVLGEHGFVALGCSCCSGRWSGGCAARSRPCRAAILKSTGPTGSHRWSK